MLCIALVLCFLSSSLVSSKDLSINLTFKTELSQVSSFIIDIDTRMAQYSSPTGLLFCNLLDRTQQLHSFLYPSNVIIRPFVKQELTCFTNQYLNCKGIFTINVIMTNVDNYNEELYKSITVKVQSSSSIDLLKLVSRSAKYVTEITKTKPIELIRPHHIEVETRFGYKMLVEENDNTISQSIREYGMWQTNIARVLLVITKSGDSVLHLGGHIGTFDVLFANLVGSKGKVVVFEPFPKSFQLLVANLKLNHVDHIVTPIMKGAFSERTQSEIKNVPENTGASYITNQLKGNPEFVANLVRIDDELPDMKIDILMMDIEGCEIHAYNGMKKVLRNSGKKPIMIWEWGFKMIKTNFNNESGNYMKALDELTEDHDFFVVDLFEDIYVKVSIEFLKDPQKHGNFDILIVPRDHRLNAFFNDNSIILNPPSPFSDFDHNKQEVVSIQLNELDVDECNKMIQYHKSKIGSRKVVCYTKQSYQCTEMNYYWCGNTPQSYYYKNDL